MIVAVAVDPDDRYPLWLALEPVDFAHQLAVGSFFVTVDDDHVEKVTVNFLHLAGFFNDLFQIVVLHWSSNKRHTKTKLFSIFDGISERKK